MILETKLQPPSLKPNTLQRERLLKLLKNNLERKLVLITGDAGYGKTTLLAQAIEEAHLTGVYYDLDRGDSDLVAFCSYLVHGLEKLQKGLASRTMGLLEQGGEVGKNYELLFGTLINELVEKRKEELFFLLDDYHALSEDNLVHKALDYFIDHLPDIVHVVIASRTVPPLPSLAKWRAKEDLFELSREGLKFTVEEVRSLLTEVYKMVLTEEEIKRVSEQTEGWITGIRLVLQSAGKDGKTVKETLNGYLEANQPLFEYFANEIVASEPLAVQEFLRKSSILDAMTPEACDKIFHLEESEVLLRGLEKRNLFLSSVGKAEYKYHRLFREFLENRMKDEGFKKALHLRAADYYQRKEDWEQAIEHYLQAGSFEWAGKVIVQVADEMEEQARFTTLVNWLKQIPDEVYEKQPELFVIQGTLCREYGDILKAEKILDQAAKSFKKRGDSYALAESLLEQSRHVWMQGEYNKALRILRKALAVCPASEGKTREHIYNATGMAWRGLGDLTKAKSCLVKAKRICEDIKDARGLNEVDSNLGILLAHQGEAQLAFDLYRALIERVEEKYQLRIGVMYASAAVVALDHGRLNFAEQWLERGWRLCEPYGDTLSHAALRLGFGALNLQRGQFDRAEEDFEEVRRETTRLNWLRMEIVALRNIAQLHRYRGSFEEAELTLNLAQQKVGEPESLLNAMLAVERSRLWASCGTTEKANEIVNQSQRMTRRFGWKVGAFLNMLSEAEIYLKRAKNRDALRALARAIRLSSDKGYEGILMRELHHCPRLREIAQKAERGSMISEDVADYLRKLLTLCSEASGVKTGEPKTRVQLFGKFELFIRGLPKTAQLRRKTNKAIFSFFLLHPTGSFTWEEITSWAWPDSSASTAHQMFRNSLREIRSIAPEIRALILYTDGRYRLNPDAPLWVDTAIFYDILQQSSASVDEEKKSGFLEEAVTLYQGPLLPGLYYSWVDDLRNALEERYIQALKSLAEMHAKNEEHTRSAHYCLKYLEIDELDEGLHRLLMTNYIRLGRQSKALKHYEQLRRILRKELKSEPTPETASLFSSLR